MKLIDRVFRRPILGFLSAGFSVGWIFSPFFMLSVDRQMILNNGQTFFLTLAETPYEIERGLMFLPFLMPDRGMLFEIPDDRRDIRFWMKNTFIPLDIIFLGSEGHIIYIKENAKLCIPFQPCPSFGPASDQETYQVVELPAGSVQRYSLVVGEQLYFR